jgi:hypothetical protein
LHGIGRSSYFHLQMIALGDTLFSYCFTVACLFCMCDHHNPEVWIRAVSPGTFWHIIHFHTSTSFLYMIWHFYGKGQLYQHKVLWYCKSFSYHFFFPTAAARVRSCGICGGQRSTGADILWVLWFPLPIFIPPFASQSPSSIIWGWYNRPVVAAAPSGLCLTPLGIIIIKKNK